MNRVFRHRYSIKPVCQEWPSLPLESAPEIGPDFFTMTISCLALEMWVIQKYAPGFLRKGRTWTHEEINKFAPPMETILKEALPDYDMVYKLWTPKLEQRYLMKKKACVPKQDICGF